MKVRHLISSLALTLVAASLVAGCAGRCADCGKTIRIDRLEGVHFDFNRAAIKKAGKKILDEDVALLKSNKSLDISIEGHCDKVGTDIYNQQLSERRARVVYNYFLKKGVSADRMRTVGYGRSNPIAPNDTPVNRAKNRRVEIHIIKARP